MWSATIGSGCLKKEVAKSIASTTKQAMVDVWLELSNLITKVKERLSDPDKIFKDSLIKNLQDFCERAKDENYTNDEKLEEIRQNVLKTLASVDPQDLRENRNYRKAKAKTANCILESIRKIDLDLE